MNAFVMRHGETAWTVSGRHTGTTDIPLTDNGLRLAERLCPILAKEHFVRVSSADAGARGRPANWRVSAMAGATTLTWSSENYGEYEGLTPEQIHQSAPNWLIFRAGCA
jgi:probable phosphoglycerate mutase